MPNLTKRTIHSIAKLKRARFNLDSANRAGVACGAGLFKFNGVGSRPHGGGTLMFFGWWPVVTNPFSNGDKVLSLNNLGLGAGPVGDILGDAVSMSRIFPNKNSILVEYLGGPRRIRTPDPLIRSQVLYPAELSVRASEAIDLGARRCKGFVS